jgi:hypothetical protein
MGKRECQGKKNDGEMGTRRMKTGIDGKRGMKVQNVPRGERGNRAHVERMR